MTQRERLEQKLEKRQDWAAGRRTKAAAGFAAGDKFRGDWAFNTQPGHIPERARVIRATDRAFENLKVADHHDSRAAGLEAQLERSVFSDDDDAIEQLRARIAENEAKAERYAQVNKAWRKAKGDDAAKITGLLADGTISEALAKTIVDTMRQCTWLKTPFDATNVRARIRSDKERIAEIELQRTRAQKAEDSGGVLIQGTGEYVAVTFAEKPERAILDDLRGANFRWGSGRWVGLRAKLPASVTALASPPAPSV